MSDARKIRGARTRANFRGCLLGGAVGDALGAPIEFKTLAEIRAEFGPAGLRDYTMAYKRLGAVTDDTQMTLFTAEALLRAEHLRHRIPEARVGEVAWHAYLRGLETQGDVVQRRGIPDEDGWLVRMRDLHAVRAPGDTCLSALRKGRMGTPEVPINASKGCGGVMRSAPFGLLLGLDVGTVHAMACESAGFMPRSLNHFIVKSRTVLLRARSASTKASPCSMAASAAWLASTFRKLALPADSQAFIFAIASGWPTA